MKLKNFALTTSDIASLAGVKPESIHHSLSVNGNYLGITPVKAVNGRLLWPADQVAVLFGRNGPETAFDAVKVLMDRVAYCEGLDSFCSADIGNRFWAALDAVLGAGQSLGLLMHDMSQVYYALQEASHERA